MLGVVRSRMSKMYSIIGLKHTTKKQLKSVTYNTTFLNYDNSLSVKFILSPILPYYLSRHMKFLSSEC